MNVNISTGQSDPKLQPESEYPIWIWSARGPCRASIKAATSTLSTKTRNTMTQQIPISELEIGSDKELELAKLKKILRTENRKGITKNNSMLKGTN